MLSNQNMIRTVLLFVGLIVSLIGRVEAEGSLQGLDPTVQGAEIGRTRQDSRPGQIKVTEAPAGAPNIVIVLLDDVGFSAASTFGGAVSTPVLDRLAKEGVSFNNFHTAGVCSPTRAALLTGRNQHDVGTGSIVEAARGFPGYTGVIPKSTVTIAEILRRSGYGTAFFGKHHNTPFWEIQPTGPFDRWPTGLGFERFYGFLAGEAHQWDPVLYQDTTPVTPPDQPEYHFTEDMAEQAIAWIRQQKAVDLEKPFFVYWAPGATHAPHHVHQKWIDKYKGRFDRGWDALREESFLRQKELGVIPPNARLTPRHSGIPAWDTLTPDQQRIAARLMEAFAGFLDHTDQQVGRLVKAIQNLGEWDNTLFLYIVGDNGGSPEGGIQGGFNEMSAFNGVREDSRVVLERLDEIGGPSAYNHFSAGFAWATNTPFQWTKQVASHFGGTRNPLVVTWPSGLKDKGAIRNQFHHVNDVVPTILEILDIEVPEGIDGVDQQPMDGVSMLYTFEQADAPSRHETQYFEALGNRAIYHDGWIASARHGRLPWVLAAKPTDFDDDVWELYNLREDFSQSNDLAEQYPDKLKELQELFWEQAVSNNVLPLDAGSVDQTNLNPTGGRKTFSFPAGISLNEWIAPSFKNRSHWITVDLDRPTNDADGVLVAQGGSMGGWSLYLEDGYLTYSYNYLGFNTTRIVSSERLPVGKSVVRFEFAYDGGGMGKGGRVFLYVDDKQIAKGSVEKTIPFLYSANETFDIGRDRGSPVQDYQGPDEFTGSIYEARVELK